MTDVDARYALWHGIGHPVTVEEHAGALPMPDGSVLVAIEAATVCGSDLHTALGHRAGPAPSVLGHEQVGHVVAIAPGSVPTTVAGVPVALGDRIVWSVAASCGTCDRCRAGLPQKCRSLRKYGHEASTADWLLNGGFATHCVLLPGTAIAVVPEHLPAVVAAPAACATATVAAALDAVDRPLAGARVLVTGAGMLGVTAVAMAVAAGATVVVSDPNARRRALAVCFGADAAVSPGEPVGAVDVAIELSGYPDAVETAVDSLDVGGTAVLVGAVSSSRPVSLDPERIVRGLLRIVGVHNYAPRHLATAVEFLASTDLPFADLVEPAVGLEGVDHAVVTPPSAGYLRRAVVPSSMLVG